jgi:hypothetical protein
LDDWRLVDAELDASVELDAPVKKGSGGSLRWRRRTTRWRRPRGGVGLALEKAVVGHFGG